MVGCCITFCHVSCLWAPYIFNESYRLSQRCYSVANCHKTNFFFEIYPYLYKSLCSNHKAQTRGPTNVRKSIICRTFWPSSSNPFVKESKGCEEKASVYFWSFQGWHILENQFWTMQHLQLGHNRWSPNLIKFYHMENIQLVQVWPSNYFAIENTSTSQRPTTSYKIMRN